MSIPVGADSQAASGSAASLTFSSVSRTHVGHVRRINEDRVLDRPDRGLWAVADGMGGHRGGDVAAELVIKELRSVADAPEAVSSAAILSALARANDKTLQFGETVGAMIGSTIVALHIHDHRADLFWAGDSRAYLAGHSQLRQLTTDHSVVQELVDAGALDRRLAARHPQANVITRALGVDANIDIETASLPIEPGDVLLLCSDGLNCAIDNRDAVKFASALSATADRFLAEALCLDGSDNISLVLVKAA